MNIIVIGGGWAGVSAAIAARKAGARVTLVEKTDLLLGAGNVGGIFRNNGRFTAAEECAALGAGELFAIMDALALHTRLDIPGNAHAGVYNVTHIEPHVRRLAETLGIDILTESRVTGVDFADGQLRAVTLADDTRLAGDAFVEATGTSGPQGNCLAHGNGCVMCIQRCPAYGPRISISAKCGTPDLRAERAEDVIGVFSGACELPKDSLAPDLRAALERDGAVMLRVPPEDVNYDKLRLKACTQYALKEYSDHLILLDNGCAKVMTPCYPLHKLRAIPGLENARFADPCAGAKGNSVRFLAIAPRANDMRVDGVTNLFCAGEKSGPFVGHTEAVCTGALAGHNAARHALRLPLVTLPDTLAIGDIISFANKIFKDDANRRERFTFAGGVFFERMKTRGLYTTDISEIRARVAESGLAGLYDSALEVPN